MLIVALAALAGTAVLLGGCERVPEHIMNSPPALDRPPLETPGQGAPDPDAPPVDLSPRDSVPAPHPQDRLASYQDDAPKPDEAKLDEATMPDQLARAAEQALARVGAPSVPLLVAELDSENPQRRQRAAQALARIGPDAIDAAESLVERLEDENEEQQVQLACAAALKEMGPALWPAEPRPFLEPFQPEPSELLSEDSDNPQIVALAEVQTLRRVQYEERSDRLQQLYELELQDYQRRSAIAQRAIDALMNLALD